MCHSNSCYALQHTISHTFDLVLTPSHGIYYININKKDILLYVGGGRGGEETDIMKNHRPIIKTFL